MHSPSADGFSRQPRILVVDDDSTVSHIVRDYLELSGLTVEGAADGVTAMTMALDGDFDVVVLDIMLPGIDGLEVLRSLRRSGRDTSVIVLTAKDGEADRILGFELGADDYVTKPFSPRELVLRVQSQLRRAGGGSGEANETRQTYVSGNLRLDMSARTATIGGALIPLTLREFDLLAFFITHPHIVHSRETLMREIWGWTHGDPSTVTVHVRRLREKIEEDASAPSRLVTVWGKGYRWDEPS